MGEALRWVTVAVASAVVVETWRQAHTLRVATTEERVFRLFNERPDSVHIPVWAVMQAGSLAAVFVVGAVLWLSDDHPESWVTVVVGVAVWGGVKLVKPAVGRGRPGAHLPQVHVRGQAQTGLGYPSGHAAVSLTLALVSTHGASTGIQLGAIAVAVFTGGARMYVGAHLPLDVVGGVAIAMIVGQAATTGIAAWG